MKRLYLHPESTMTLLFSKDVITESENIYVDDPNEDIDDTVKDPFTPQSNS